MSDDSDSFESLGGVEDEYSATKESCIFTSGEEAASPVDALLSEKRSLRPRTNSTISIDAETEKLIDALIERRSFIPQYLSPNARKAPKRPSVDGGEKR